MRLSTGIVDLSSTSPIGASVGWLSIFLHSSGLIRPECSGATAEELSSGPQSSRQLQANLNNNLCLKAARAHCPGGAAVFLHTSWPAVRFHLQPRHSGGLPSYRRNHPAEPTHGPSCVCCESGCAQVFWQDLARWTILPSRGTPERPGGWHHYSRNVFSFWAGPDDVTVYQGRTTVEIHA